MKKLLTFLMASILAIGVGWASDVTDELTISLTGITGGSGYGNWSGKTSNSSAVYAGNSAGGQSGANPSIQIRSNNDNSGIITTASGGKVKKIVITFNSYSTTTRTINVYGKNSAYTSPSELYDASSYGTLVGTITGSASNNNKELTISGDYEYIGLRSNNGAIYIDKIEITWGTEVGTPTVATPTFTPGAGSYYEAQSVTLSCATEGADIFWGYDGESFVTYDGDPILVNKTMTLYAYAMKGGMEDSEVASAAYTITGIPTVTPPYEEGFAGNLGQFYVNNVVNPGFDVWNAGSYSGSTFAKASGYSGGAKDSESWLISPYINLTDANAPQLSFSQAIDNHFGTIANEATLWVKEKSASDWTQLTITYPETPESGYTEFEAHTIDLTAYKGKIIQIAFKYVSTADAAGNWEVANIKVDEKPLEKAYYLTGSFNDWTVKDENYKFTLQAGGSYALTGKTFEADPVKFKVLKVEGETVTWLGGATDVAEPTSETTHDLTSTWHTNIQLVDGVNFKMEFGGKCDFSISAEEKITVTKEKNLFICGGLNDWGKTQMTKTETGWEYEGQIAANTEYKFRDEWAAWYGGGAEINETNLDTEVAVNDGNNFKIVNAGNYTITVNDAVTTMVVSLVKEPHNITIAEGIENGTITIKDNKTTAKAGEVITIIATPANGYELGTVTVMAGETAVEVTEDYTFVMPDAAVVVSATFQKMIINAGDYVKVTSGKDLTSGTYLIVYEEGALAFDGGLETLDAVGNSISVTISNNKIAGGDEVDAAAFTYDTSAGSFKSASGYYIGQTIDANGLKSSQTTAYENSVSIDDDGNANIVSGGAYLRYNKTSGQTRFRYFKSSTYTGQQPIALYKKYGEVVPTLATPLIDGETPFFPTTTVTITCADEDATIYYTLDGTDPTASSTEYETPFTLEDNATVKAIAIKGNEFSTVASKEFKKKTAVATVAEAIALGDNTTAVFTGSLVVIAKVGSYCYAQDETGGILIYGNQIPAYESGDVIPSNFTATRATYKGSPQLQYPSYMQEATETAEVKVTEITPAQVTVDPYNLYMYSVIKNATIEDGVIKVGEESVTIYNDRFNVEFTPEEGKTYDVYGIPGWFNGAQFMPMKYEESKQPVLLEGVVFAEGRNWATWYGDQDLALPEGVTAYVVTGISGDKATVEPLSYIPANVGVLLYSETADETVEAMPCEPETPATITGNLLVGVAQAQEVSNAYVLYNNAFVLIQDGTQVAAHRCYLQAGGNAAGAPRVLRIAAAGTVTGIDALVTDGNSGVKYYDLSGRYVGTSLNGKRGIFITSDGKKVVR